MHSKRILYQFLILFSGLFLLGFRSSAQSPADSLLNFIIKNKKRSSLCFSRNDTILVKYNENKLMPVAGSSYILVAVEFAKQAGSFVFDAESYTSLKEVERYYIPALDSTAYTTWIADETNKGHIYNDSIQLVNVARGMLLYNINANAEFLMDLLGMDNVVSNIPLFGLTHHTPIFPVVSSVFLYQNPKKLKENSIIGDIKSLSEKQYCKISYEMHKALKNDTILKPKFSEKDFSINMQKAWSDRLPSSTTQEYVQVGKILNNRKFMHDNGYGVLAEILETAMENPTKLSWLKHEAIKEGSTPWVFTKVLYATTQQDEHIEMAYFFNGLTPAESKKIKLWADEFEDKAISDINFQEKIARALN